MELLSIYGDIGKKPGSILDILQDQETSWGVYSGQNVFQDPIIAVSIPKQALHILVDIETKKSYRLTMQDKTAVYDPNLIVLNKDYSRFIVQKCFFKENPPFLEIRLLLESAGFKFFEEEALYSQISASK